jgi:hypothetical protein
MRWTFLVFQVRVIPPFYITIVNVARRESTFEGFLVQSAGRCDADNNPLSIPITWAVLL